MSRTIASFVAGGINDIGDLHAALHLAMQLEFATIPPYLCAQWSIHDDPDRVEGVLHRIVGQEMFHLALAGNILAAIGGRPHIASPDFLARYPVSKLPGDIELAAPLALRPLDRSQLAVFMDIEKPEFPPIALVKTSLPSIGAFYDTIVAALQSIDPGIDPDAAAISLPGYSRIASIADAIGAIERIKQEGEGLPASPEQPATERDAHAHYYLFKEIALGKRLIFDNGAWQFAGAAVTMPRVHVFSDQASPCADNIRLRSLLVRLLTEIEQSWTIARPFDVATMFELELVGRALIRNGITPQFVWPE